MTHLLQRRELRTTALTVPLGRIVHAAAFVALERLRLFGRPRAKRDRLLPSRSPQAAFPPTRSTCWIGESREERFRRSFVAHECGIAAALRDEGLRTAS